ncbi:MAG TPA: NADH-quinone oxidoreductase subunit L [Burkholderiaceae bacterium]|jgi:NADH-quinone oxidoreductase subunit L|nr:NADH-quinone oxidoreductase subunit L [Burkholderiaceae bacterium]
MDRWIGLCLIVPLAPLAGALIAGLLGRTIGRQGAHWAAILGVAAATIASALVFQHVVLNRGTIQADLYTWTQVGAARFNIGFLIDTLTATMMLVVSFVSLMIHVYTIGYMADDPGYRRFFAYIALFTFSMLMLVMSNNFLQLFFGWEAVGLVSYLLIGFWYERPTAIAASLKAFLVNRVGDLGFLLGIALVFAHFGTLDYRQVFGAAGSLTGAVLPGTDWPLATVICICLFIGAMGKSAQFPLHVWLPDSMEGPTPISALIHAATMVTAGIFMVARMSPLFELSDTALSFVLFIGAFTAFFMGVLGIVQNDIKRVIAYSTLSQLGYMAVALGASAYSVGIFHLITHAFFKALLFLGAGSVIIAMHHEQDMRKMGGLARWMPVTYLTTLIGALALIGTPGFAGFYSKDSIIEAVAHSNLPGWIVGFAQFSVTAGVFVTALYTFRMLFLTFHGKPRFDAEHHPPHESPWVVTFPLVALAIPSVVIGYLAIQRMLFSDFFAGSIFVDSARHPAMRALAEDFRGALEMALDSVAHLPLWLAAAGVATAWFLYLKRPDLPQWLRARFGGLYAFLDNKYYMDRFNEIVFGTGGRLIGRVLWRGGDVAVIDGVAVNGSARLVGWIALLVRRAQTGYIYHYAFAMLVGVAAVLFAFLTWPYIVAASR